MNPALREPGVARAADAAARPSAVGGPAWAALSDLVPSSETILLTLRPHPVSIVLRPLGLLLNLGLVAAISLWLDARGLLGGYGGRAAAAAAVCGGLTLGWHAVDWSCRLYVLTDRRVMRLAGVFRQVAYDAPLRSIQHVIVFRSVRERLCGLGSVGFATAGSVSIEFSWFMVANPVAVVRVVREAIDRYGSGTGSR
ncbi:MAG: PH domain-containing protein [Phycisphaerae bacterium]|nr:PH domain-containing protein [Phycisphaerae bacterium]